MKVLFSEQLGHVRGKSEATISKLETIPNGKSQLKTLSCQGLFFIIWILILALVLDFRYSDFEFWSASYLSAVMPALRRAIPPCAWVACLLGRLFDGGNLCLRR